MRRNIWIVLLLLLGACGGGGKSHDIGPGGSSPDLSDVFVYDQASPYAALLKGCATAENLAALCTMNELPLLGQETSAPTISGLMDRVLVSHAWMAVRFEEVLAQLPPDILTLFKGVTAIVIDSDVRPSFYSSGTAAIYLDPANLWLTNDEKATISQAPDYRSDFGAELQFVGLWRYVLDNNYAYDYYSLGGTETRQLSDIIYPMARLLYHELAHANDYLPPALQETLDRQLTPYRAIISLLDDGVSARLYETSPLTSQVWSDLAEVLYRGFPATTTQKSYSAEYVGNEFEIDGANDPYGYASVREDLAMLFEETMMKYHYDIDRDIAFSDRPAADPPACDDYIVHWGVRNRLGAAGVKDRARMVADELLPDTDLTAFFTAIPEPGIMLTEVGWCSNLTLGAATPSGLGPGKEIWREQLRQDLLIPGD